MCCDFKNEKNSCFTWIVLKLLKLDDNRWNDVIRKPQKEKRGNKDFYLVIVRKHTEVKDLGLLHLSILKWWSTYDDNGWLPLFGEWSVSQKSCILYCIRNYSTLLLCQWKSWKKCLPSHLQLNLHIIITHLSIQITVFISIVSWLTYNCTSSILRTQPSLLSPTCRDEFKGGGGFITFFSVLEKIK